MPDLEISIGVKPDAFLQNGAKRLYVEGDEDSIDSEVMELLTIGTGLSVRPLGASSGIRAAVRALHNDHPSYAFLIDRDFLDDAKVEATWNGFPDPAQHNLLIWRKRSIENYFLDVEWLEKSQYFDKAKKQSLIDKLVNEAKQRVFMDVANIAVSETRGLLLKSWIDLESDPAKYKTAEMALENLLKRKEWADIPPHVSDILSKDKIAVRFNTAKNELIGDGDKLRYGAGRWIDLMNAKPLLNSILTSSLFRVSSEADGAPLQGELKRLAIVRDLICNSGLLPADFKQIQDLLKNFLASPLAKPAA